MKGKRFLGGLIALFCLTGNLALAEAQTVLRTWDSRPDAGFEKIYPHLTIEPVYYDHFDSFVEQIRKEKADVITLRLYNHSLAPFVENGMAADLSANNTIAAAVARMPDWIRQQVITEDGRMIALPTSASVSPFYWYQDAWDAAGLSAEDVPQSYTELLDFLNEWVERIRREPEKDVCVSRLANYNTGDEEFYYARWLMEALLLSHEMQQQYAGKAITFQTATFMELAVRTKETAIALYQTEPKQRSRQHMMQLFQSDINGGEHANNGRTYGLSHSIPLRLDREQPALCRLDLEVVFLSSDSALKKEGMQLIEYLMQQRDTWFFQYALYTDFEPGDYPYEGGGVGHVDAGWLRDYHEYHGEFVSCPRAFHCSPDAMTGKKKLMMQFFRGEITAETFAKELDRLIDGQEI